MTRLLPWWARLGAVAALALSLYGLGRLHQAEADSAERAREDRARLEATVQQLGRRAAIAHKVATAYESDRERIRVVHQTIVREVPHVIDRPVYRDCRLDADGVRLLTAALAGRAPDPAGQPPGAVPRPERPP